jgi:nondiscriminating aspartyl-tRNA synthetase
LEEHVTARDGMLEIETRRCWARDLAERRGDRVEVRGWVQRVRDLSGITFLVIRDGTGTCQAISEDDDVRAQLRLIPAESIVAVDGTVVASEQAPSGVEIRVTSVSVLSAPDEQPPIELFRAKLKEQLPTILDHAAVSLRHPRTRAAFRLGAASLRGFRQTLDADGFVEVHTPKLVASATEGGANVFEVAYFDRKAYLAQSPQFYKQMLVGVFERVYEIGPVFRAEPHATVRHLNEYVSLDLEMGFITDHFDVMTQLRSVLVGMVTEMRTSSARELDMLKITLPAIPSDIPWIAFRDARALLEREGAAEGPLTEPDLAPNEERWLGEWASRTHESEFLFVTGYPLSKRPFYTHPDPTDPNGSNGFDLLFRGLELATGGQRLHREADYRKALAMRQIDAEPFEGYLEAFRFGMPPHGGFAIGYERWLAQLVGAANIRETTLFPRDLNRLAP